MSRTALAILAAVVALAAPARAVDPDPKSLEISPEADAKARRLVAQLGDRGYFEREQADRELRALGRVALPAIRHAIATETNAEIQLRCEMLLPQATTDDIKARVECFLADDKGKFQHDLPGASKYFEVVGKSDEARKLFREMILSANRAMLSNFDKPEELAKAVAARKNQFRPYYASDDGSGRGNPTAVDLAAILFADAYADQTGTANARNASIASQFVNQPILRTCLEGAEKDVYRALFEKWVDNREDAYSLYYSMNLCKSLKLPNGMKCAKKLVASKTGPASYRGYGMSYIAQNGTAEDLPLLEGLLTEKTLLTTLFLPANNGNRRMSIQTRDAALALCLLLQKQNPADFGLTARTPGASDIVRFNMTQHYIDEDDAAEADKKRDAAIDKYNKWKAEAKKK